MLANQLIEIIDKAGKKPLCDALKCLMEPHGTPVFGAAKIIEHEVAALRALTVLGFLKSDADEYDLVEKLRITKAKARSLQYQAALRAMDGADAADIALRKVLSQPRIMKEGNAYLIEVHEPLTMGRLRKRVRSMGFMTDGSFSGSVAKIPEDALAKLVAALLPEALKAEVTEQLIQQGFTDVSMTGFIKGMLAKCGGKLAGAVGDKVASTVGEKIAEFLINGWSVLSSHVQDKNTDDMA